MALISARFSIIRGIRQLSVSRKNLESVCCCRLHHFSTTLNYGSVYACKVLHPPPKHVILPRTSISSGATTNVDQRHKLFGTSSTSNDRNQNKYHRLLSFIGFFVSLSGFIFYWKKNSYSFINTQFPFSTVFALSTSDDSSLPPSKRFNFIADVVDKAAPAVVFIELKERFPFSSKVMTLSNGSGFVVRSDGLILTNAHVVANKSTAHIRLHDGREFEGTVIAVDPVSDLAAIKVNVGGLPVLKMGKSSTLRAGEWVVAMGSPLSLSNTVTCGIISTVNRHSKDLGLKHKDMDYIQTDALINFGNSGGPLVNLDAEVIGINTMKVTAGISFAIPADYANGFLSKVDEILKKGQPKKRQWFNMGSDTTRRRFIGITMLTLSSELLLDLKTRMADFPNISGGVLVHKIVVGSPAFNGGLRAGDIMIEINGTSIQSSTDVYKLVEDSETLKITVFRGSHKLSFNVTPEDVN